MKTSLILLTFLLGHSPRAMVQTPGAFPATGSMSMPRSGHTATVLLDGRVLIPGGDAVGTAV